MELSKRMLLGITSLIILITATVTYTLAQSSSTIPFTIYAGIYPGAPSYTVWVESGNYFAKNASGAVEFSGTDASTVIQSVFNSYDLQHYGGKVYFKKGDYLLSSPLTYQALPPSGYLTLEGESQSVVKLDGSNLSDYAFTCFTSGRLTIKNLRIYGGTYVKGPAGMCSFENVHFRGTQGRPALRVEDLFDSTIHNCIFDYGKGGLEIVGVQIQLGSNALKISNIEIYGCKDYLMKLEWVMDVFITNSAFEPYGVETEYWGDGIIISHSKEITIANSKIAGKSDTSGNYDLIKITGNSTFKSEGITLSSNNIWVSVYGQMRSAIYIDWARDILIVGNKILAGNVGTATRAIYLTNNATKCIFSCNYVWGTILNSATEPISFANNIIYIINHGYTSNSGTATILSGQTSVTVNHGLVETPTVVTVTGRHSETASCYVSARTSTTITISVPSPVTADRIVDWYAEYKP